MPDSTVGGGFAELLRELKDRSGLSYGVLSKRLHMSTSTLHRYCNGDAVPAEYAPVERLARLCKATPEELVELHRRWVLADAMRGRKAEAAPANSVPAEPQESEELQEPEEPQESAEPEAVAEAAEPRDATAPGERVTSVRTDTRRRRRTRTALVAGVAVAAVLGGVTLAVNLASDDSDAAHGGPVAAASTQDGKPGGGHSAKAPGHTASPSASGTGSASPSSSASASGSATGEGDKPGAHGKVQGGESAAPPLTVATQPYTWESPCEQRYLIERPPTDVAPPPTENDATAWVAAHGAVSSGEQFVTLTVQGTGKETVVVESLTVRSDKRSPLAWNDYAMGYPGVGCGGGVPTRSFTVALDAARPAVVPAAGHRNFPFKVSESDPEVYYIKADASAYDVSWYLELTWSSGSRHGTLRIDDHGRPFRTSGNNGRPAYEFPLGGSAWVKEGTTKS
ncbi:helix-turn-helix domain-containing protein [Streptomyces olivochromogenes]|uniref:helix-turn-helix domain-containing protein n=1 Tax=Streptomyces olivochromogenes TaxID=1963 RepID=UPI001F2E27D2|nr:helix-turn-helix transcriptional regulator [Streptomyces olivochromogenes]MCF3136444.1 helix-turn-helix domain-containing protein [Streptomyces olivochromogenes]